MMYKIKIREIKNTNVSTHSIFAIQSSFENQSRDLINSDSEAMVL